MVDQEDVLHQERDDRHRERRVRQEQDAWRRTRRVLNARRPELSRLAARLYPPRFRVGDTSLIAEPGWLPAEPVELGDIQLTYDVSGPEPVLDGTGPETAHVRPLASTDHRYPRYSQALRALAPPRLFENRASWRLTDVTWSAGKGAMTFGPTTYFAGIDTYEAVAHELAFVALDERGVPRPAAPTLPDLPFRHRIGDPFDLSRRPVLASVDTLTVRRDATGAASFLLHRRDAGSVAVAGGMLQVVPVGIFQPCHAAPGAVEADFDLWRAVMREFAEEVLGEPEYGGDGRPARCDAEPFRTLERARDEGRLRVSCLGVGVDALTLVGEILTVLVVDAEVFDALAADRVGRNAEGELLGRVPFTREALDRVARDRIAPAGAGLLHLAWRHRSRLLGRE